MAKHIDERVSPYDLSGMHKVIYEKDKEKDEEDYKLKLKNVSPYDVAGMQKYLGLIPRKRR